jgi:hypothetical protein
LADAHHLRLDARVEVGFGLGLFLVQSGYSVGCLGQQGPAQRRIVFLGHFAYAVVKIQVA